MSAFRALLAAMLVCAASAAATYGKPPARAEDPSQSDVDAGKETFANFCSGCHGLDATGGQAPNIQRAPATYGDDAVAKIIKGGRPGTGMPAFAGLTDAQISQIVAYIRSLASAVRAARASQLVNGDATKGKSVYAQNGCANCHTIAGDGGNIGPELTEIGNVRSPNYLRSALVNPGADLPKTGRVARDRGMWTAYLVFRAVTKDGKTVEGMRAGEDSFDIVLEDAKGNFYSLHKPDLKSLEKEPTKSFMPSYQATVSGADLDNLVAYLASLKGAQ